MTDGYRTGAQVAWSSDYCCAYSFVGHTKDTWSLFGPDAHTPVATFAPPGVAATWSDNGQVLFLTNASNRLLRIEFAPGDPVPSKVIDITPKEWDSEGPAAVGLCDGSDGSLYALVEFANRRFLSAWRISCDGRGQPDLIADELTFATSDLYKSTRGPVVIQLNHPKSGMIRLRLLRDNLQTDYSLSGDEKIITLALSEAADACLYSTGIAAPEAKLWLFELATAVTRFVGHGAYGSLSPDNQHIAVARADQQLLILRNGGEVVEELLSAEPFCDEERLPYIAPLVPQWSPDGQCLVFFLFRWGKANERERASPQVIEQATFVLNLTTRVVTRLPIFSQSWAWRPVLG